MNSSFWKTSPILSNGLLSHIGIMKSSSSKACWIFFHLFSSFAHISKSSNIASLLGRPAWCPITGNAILMSLLFRAIYAPHLAWGSLLPFDLIYFWNPVLYLPRSCNKPQHKYISAKSFAKAKDFINSATPSLCCFIDCSSPLLFSEWAIYLYCLCPIGYFLFISHSFRHLLSLY